MIQTLLQTVITTVGIAALTAAPAHPVHSTPVVPQTRMHIVSEGESLSQIAEKSYHTKDAWATILKDNPQIADPDLIEEGTVLKLRVATPSAEEIKQSMPTKMHDSIVLEVTPAPEVTEAVAAPVAEAPVYTGGPLSEEQITFLGTCEAGMDPAKNTGNGYYGAFQFSYGTWKSMETGYERADLAPLEVQKAAVQRLLSRSSIFTQFPGCAKKMRSLGLI